MCDPAENLDRLRDALEALERIPRRFASIRLPSDFLADEAGREHLDSICMVLVAVGEAFRQLDARSKGKWRTRFNEIPWGELIGVRNVIAHGYFDIDHEEVFSICQKEIPKLIADLRRMIDELEADAAR